MRGFGGSTLRGGQTVFHSLRMWGQLVAGGDDDGRLHDRRGTGLEPVALAPAGAEWYAAGMYTLAEVKLVTVGYESDSGQEIRFRRWHAKGC